MPSSRCAQQSRSPPQRACVAQPNSSFARQGFQAHPCQQAQPNTIERTWGPRATHGRRPRWEKEQDRSTPAQQALHAQKGKRTWRAHERHAGAAHHRQPVEQRRDGDAPRAAHHHLPHPDLVSEVRRRRAFGVRGGSRHEVVAGAIRQAIGKCVDWAPCSNPPRPTRPPRSTKTKDLPTPPKQLKLPQPPP